MRLSQEFTAELTNWARDGESQWNFLPLLPFDDEVGADRHQVAVFLFMKWRF